MTKNVAVIPRRRSAGRPAVIWLPWLSSKLNITGLSGSGVPRCRCSRYWSAVTVV